jgi:hypothetical protein
VTITITEATNPALPGEFLPALTITGINNTTGETFTGTGTALYDGAAPVGPGTFQTSATITTNVAVTTGATDYLYFLGTGASANTGPEVAQTIGVTVGNLVTGEPIQYTAPIGTLTRQQ